MSSASTTSSASFLCSVGRLGGSFQLSRARMLSWTLVLERVSSSVRRCSSRTCSRSVWNTSSSRAKRRQPYWPPSGDRTSRSFARTAGGRFFGRNLQRTGPPAAARGLLHTQVAAALSQTEPLTHTPPASGCGKNLDRHRLVSNRNGFDRPATWCALAQHLERFEDRGPALGILADPPEGATCANLGPDGKLSAGRSPLDIAVRESKNQDRRVGHAQTVPGPADEWLLRFLRVATLPPQHEDSYTLEPSAATSVALSQVLGRPTAVRRTHSSPSARPARPRAIAAIRRRRCRRRTGKG